MTQSSDLIQ